MASAAEEEIGRLVIRLLGDSAQYLATVAGAERETSRLGQVVEQVGRAMQHTFQAVKEQVADVMNGMRQTGLSMLQVGGVVGGAADLVALSALKVSANIEQIKISFTTMLGSAKEANDTLKNLFHFADTTPFTQGEVLEAARGLVTFGERGKDLYDTLNLIGNAASATGTQFSMLALIFNQVRGVGHLIQQDFRQLSTRGIISLDDLANHFKITRTEANQMLTDGKIGFNDLRETLKELNAEGGRFAHMMVQQGQSLAGLMSTLSDTITRVLQDIGDTLATVVKPAVQGAIAILGAWQQVPHPIRIAIAALIGLAAVIGTVVTAVGGLLFTITILIPAVVGLTFAFIRWFATNTLLTGQLPALLQQIPGLQAAFFALTTPLRAVVELIMRFIGLGGSFAGSLALQQATSVAARIASFGLIDAIIVLISTARTMAITFFTSVVPAMWASVTALTAWVAEVALGVVANLTYTGSLWNLAAILDTIAADIAGAAIVLVTQFIPAVWAAVVAVGAFILELLAATVLVPFIAAVMALGEAFAALAALDVLGFLVGVAGAVTSLLSVFTILAGILAGLTVLLPEFLILLGVKAVIGFTGVNQAAAASAAQFEKLTDSMVANANEVVSQGKVMEDSGAAFDFYTEGINKAEQQMSSMRLEAEQLKQKIADQSGWFSNAKNWAAGFFVTTQKDQDEARLAQMNKTINGLKKASDEMAAARDNLKGFVKAEDVDKATESLRHQILVIQKGSEEAAKLAEWEALSQTKASRESLAAYKKAADELDRFKKIQDMAKDAEKQAADEAKEHTRDVDSLNQSVSEYLSNLIDEVDKLNGVSDEQIRLNKWQAEARKLGVELNADQLEAIHLMEQRKKTLQDSAKAQEEVNKLMEKGKQVTDEFATPIEKYKKKVEELTTLYNTLGEQGERAINRTNFDKALKAADEELKKNSLTVDIDFNATGLEGIKPEVAKARAEFQNIMRQVGSPTGVDKAIADAHKDIDNNDAVLLQKANAAATEAANEQIDEQLALYKRLEDFGAITDPYLYNGPQPNQVSVPSAQEAPYPQGLQNDNQKMLEYMKRIAEGVEAQSNAEITFSDAGLT